MASILCGPQILSSMSITDIRSIIIISFYIYDVIISNTRGVTSLTEGSWDSWPSILGQECLQCHHRLLEGEMVEALHLQVLAMVEVMQHREEFLRQRKRHKGLAGRWRRDVQRRDRWWRSCWNVWNGSGLDLFWPHEDTRRFCRIHNQLGFIFLQKH